MEQTPSEKMKETGTDRFLKDNILPSLQDFVVILSAALLLFVLLFRIVVVSGPSMNNTLLDKDYLLLLSSSVYQDPKQGDIIVASKASFENGDPFIKRVIALEGQEVDIDFEQGIVYVDGKALDEPYTLTPTTRPEGVEFPLVVAEGCVFVMGDNRDRSKDSRSRDIGLVDKREILGKAIFLIFPGADEINRQRDYSRIGVIP